MPPKNDIFETLTLRWGHSYKPYDNILAKVDYIEQTDAGLKVHCHKVDKEKKMNKNEELKNVDTIIITRDGDAVYAYAYDKRSGFSHHTTCHKTTAECSPNDIFDFNIGAKLAFDRLYEGYDFTPRSKELFSGTILFINPDHEDNEFVRGCSVWKVKDGLITSLDYANSKNRNLRILKNMPCSKLAERVNDMYFPCYNDWSKRNKVMYLEKE